MTVLVSLFLVAAVSLPDATITQHAAIETLVHVTTGAKRIETPTAGQELCIFTNATTDPYWSPVVQYYLKRFSSYPRVLLNAIHLNRMQLHRCSLYILIVPNIEGLQLYRLLVQVSSGTNWNQAANFIIGINDHGPWSLGHLLNVFRAFPPLGIRNACVLRHGNGKLETLVSDYKDRAYGADVTDPHRALLTQDRNRNLDRRPVQLKTRFAFPYLTFDSKGVTGVYNWFFLAFAQYTNARILYTKQQNATKYDVALKIYTTEKRLKPISLGSISGNCIVLPEVSKKGLFYFLLIPFAPATWILCGTLTVLALVLSWKLPKHIPNSLLLTVLFGDQAADERQYTTTERRLLIIGNVLLFFFTEAYWAKLHSLFIDSLNVPRLRTVEEFLRSNIPLEVVHANTFSYDQKLHSDRLITVSDIAQQIRNVQHGRCAFLVSCNNALYLLKLMRTNREAYRVQYYILEQPVSSHLEGFAVFKHSPVADQLLHFTGIVQQAGLIGYWSSLYVHQLDGFMKRTFVLQETLGWDDLASLQYLLIIGHLFALLVFVVEVLVGKFYRRKHKP